MWLCHGILFISLAVVACQDGSTPEEICPCQTEDLCQNERHIFGSDAQDIEKFGLISPCRESEEYPCCPREPPPPKKIQLTPQDLQDFSPAELAELGVTPEGTIGSSSLPLAEQPDQSKLIEQNQLPIDITQPGAASLAPHGATSFRSKAQPNQQKVVHSTTQRNPAIVAQNLATMARNPPGYQQRPMYQRRPTYQQTPLYQPRPVHPMRPSPQYPPPQIYPPPTYTPYRKY